MGEGAGSTETRPGQAAAPVLPGCWPRPPWGHGTMEQDLRLGWTLQAESEN